jgi:uncharacterized protein (TIGR02677 family)
VDDSPAELDRLRLYAYATASQSAEYVAIMRQFAGALLAEWSAQDVAERGVDLPVDVIEQRLRYLETNGNLLVSPREVRVTSIAEYQRQPARYAATTLGVRVHRQVEEVLAAAGGAREVPRELLAAVAHRLTSLARLGPDGLAAEDPDQLSEAVSTVFLQFGSFASAVTDFYTYVGSVLARPDLDDDEWLGFKGLLLDYLETIVDAVSRHTATIRIALDALQPSLPTVIARLATAEPDIERLRVSSPGGEGIERSRGRAIDDWIELREWFGTDSAKTSGATQLRAAAARAVGALLANVKRMNAASSREASLRKHFLRLAGWFDTATPADAHVLFTSAFALYGARHLSVPLAPDVAEALPATASWWRAPGAPVPVSIRERGDRNPRGRSSRISDHSDVKRQLLEQRTRQAIERQHGIEELLAVGDRLDEVRLSGGALTVLFELLARATARIGPDLAGTSAALDDADVTLWVEPHTDGMVLRSPLGDLALDGFRAAVGRSAERPVIPPHPADLLATEEAINE